MRSPPALGMTVSDITFKKQYIPRQGYSCLAQGNRRLFGDFPGKENLTSFTPSGVT